jgi:Flp pilus assembly protein TadD
MNSHRVFTPEENARREELLRPSKFLGYNHNTLGLYLIERGAFSIAESELRRAIWLNPYEPAFMANLAWCLYRQGRRDEARQYLDQAIQQDPKTSQVLQIAELMAVQKPQVDNGNAKQSG